jgi:hypothetical protein
MDEEEIVAASPLPPLQKRTLSRGHGSRAASGRRHSELPAKKVEMPSGLTGFHLFSRQMMVIP